MTLAVVNMVDNTSLWQMARDAGVTKKRFITHPEDVKQVCPHCLSLHDTVWDIDDPAAPDPPLHPNCACEIAPEFEPTSELGKDPDGNPVVPDRAPALAPGEYLQRRIERMSSAELEKFLGPTRARLLKTGLISAKQLVSQKHGIRTVEKLMRAAKVTPEDMRSLNNTELRNIAEWRLARSKRRRRLASQAPTRKSPTGRTTPTQVGEIPREATVIGRDRSLQSFQPRIPTGSRATQVGRVDPVPPVQPALPATRPDGPTSSPHVRVMPNGQIRLSQPTTPAAAERMLERMAELLDRARAQYLASQGLPPNDPAAVRASLLLSHVQAQFGRAVEMARKVLG